jgi:peptidoglycan/LPS O-acetylase OafA/YrhL
MNPNLDLLRAVAVMCVFCAHLYDAVTNTHSDASWHVGQLGVLMFFVHTSLVLTQSIERRGIGGSRMFGQFYLLRFFRIYPLSIVAVGLAYLVGAGAWSARDAAANLTLTQNLFYAEDAISVLWSLPLEVQMYLVLPFLFIFLHRRRTVWPVLAIWVLAIPIAIGWPMISGRLSILGYVPCFLGGVIAWKMKGFEKLPGWSWPGAMGASTLVWMVATREHDMYFRWVFCLILGLTIPWFREIRFVQLRKAAAIIAKYSYGIYLSHKAALGIAFDGLAGAAFGIQFAVFLLFAILLPVAAYHLIEHPMIEVGKRLASRRFLQAAVSPP